MILYRDPRTVFTIEDIAVLTGESQIERLRNRLHYYISKGDLCNPRRGIYAKIPYLPEELACVVYARSYVSLEFVLAPMGIVIHDASIITMAGYLNRKVQIDGRFVHYRFFKRDILMNSAGIEQKGPNLRIASPERAFMDLLYFRPDVMLQTLDELDYFELKNLFQVYNCKALTKRVIDLFQVDFKCWEKYYPQDI